MSDTVSRTFYPGRRSPPSAELSREPGAPVLIYPRGLGAFGDSLAGFLKATDGYPLGSLQSVHRDSARVAAGLLGRLYGEAGPFASSSPRYQMNQNDYVDVTNRLRAYFNMSELHPPKT